MRSLQLLLLLLLLIIWLPLILNLLTCIIEYTTTYPVLNILLLISHQNVRQGLGPHKVTLVVILGVGRLLQLELRKLLLHFHSKPMLF